MTELMRVLYEYALDRQTLPSLEEYTQYKDSSAVCKRNHLEVCRLLSEEGRQRLENYIGELKLMHDLELEAMFQAGLSMGLELSRL